ncbi:leucyl-tRNA synthetase [Parathielavia appendiculata]|uniref:leucine--tRNA ligase n=1 Tax=Parathielavia appendiculata TaxID=2587402 RepID=A0AAN6U9I7_9PEZI|nr:leucyl-tRNA synthetase [Parathielavia appendiculata]
MSLSYIRSIGRSIPHLNSAASRCLLSRRFACSTPCSGPWTAVRSLSATARLYADAKLHLPALDSKWRQRWAALPESTHQCTDAAKGKYVLPMFPYPSGYLHLGHLRVYTIADVVARFHSLQGSNVLLPMGWDAFGLPAENAAIERGINPATWTRANIASMKEQLAMMNGSWNWSCELATCDPSFYKHTQKIFLLLQEKGLAYQAEAEVNYDPVDKTVLANEQVDANGFSWRSGAKVEKRKLKQWFLRISEFRESLLQDLEVLAKNDAWPERVLAMQKNWLGKSTGATIKFPLLAFDHDVHAAIEVFTSRPDTLFGVQYLALASTHPVVAKLAEKDPELQAFLDTLPGLPPDSRVGYMLPHIRAVNPLAYHEKTPEATKKSIPVYVAPYVIGDYGEGAVMGVPGHDVRDHAFWKTHHYDEPVRFVLAASEDESTTALQNHPFVDHGIMTEHSGLFKGKSSKETGEMLVAMLEQAGLAQPVEKWRLRDWLISRQRYWGTPIPIVHCDSCGAVPVPDEQLPVLLPEVDEHWAGKKTGNPLEMLEEWVNTSCPKCSGPAKRDTDTMDTFVDSSWYYMRFVDAHNEDAPFSAERVKSLPVDLYIGGIEHAILHLLYARFIYKFLMTSRLVPENGEAKDKTFEPFQRLITQGMVHGRTYVDPSTGKFLRRDEVDLSDPSSPKVVDTGETATVTYEKMSKSKHNGVDPTDVIAQHGADATRAHMLFQAPVSEILDWDGDKIVGVTRWLGRVHEMVRKLGTASADANIPTAKTYFEDKASKLQSMSVDELAQWDADVAVWLDVQRTIASVTASYEKVYPLNTVVSDLMILANAIQEKAAVLSEGVLRQAVSALVRMMAPITPAFSEECWSILGLQPEGRSMFAGEGKVSFPVVDGTLELEMLQPRKQTCAVQVNGKLRAVVEISKPNGLAGDELQDWIVGEILKTDEGSSKLINGTFDVRQAKKVIVIRDGKLVNFVL